MKKIIFRISIFSNIVLLLVLLFVGYKIRVKICDKLTYSKSYNIVMFGNSLTANGKWNRDLNRSDIKNSGNRGFTTSHFVTIIQGAVIQYNPKICFIEGGINDIGLGIPLRRTFNNYKSIVDTLLKYQIEPILQSTIYINYPNDSLTNIENSKVDSLNNFLSTLAQEKGITYLDLNKYLSSNGRLRNDLNTDGCHINSSAYKIWTREVDKIIKSKGL